MLVDIPVHADAFGGVQQFQQETQPRIGAVDARQGQALPAQVCASAGSVPAAGVVAGAAGTLGIGGAAGAVVGGVASAVAGALLPDATGRASRGSSSQRRED